MVFPGRRPKILFNRNEFSTLVSGAKPPVNLNLIPSTKPLVNQNFDDLSTKPLVKQFLRSRPPGARASVNHESA